MHKKLIQLLCCLLVILSLMSASVFAAQPTYQDVPLSHPYAADIQWLSDQNIVRGCGNQTFEPDRPITMNELTIMFTRAFGDETEQSDPWQTCLQHGWIPNLAYYYPNTKALHAHVYESLFNTAEIVIYNPGLYDESQLCSNKDTIMQAAVAFNLCDADIDGGTYITRGEVAHALHLILTNSYSQATPDIQDIFNFTYEPEFTSRVSSALCELAKLPVQIQDEFARQDWSFVLGDDYINEFDAERNTKSVGLTNHNVHTIYVSTPDNTVLHETAHFLYWHCGVDIDRVQNIFTAESKAFSSVSEYASVSASEFFAEYFAYFIDRRDNEANMNWLSHDTPLMYQYMLELENAGWVLTDMAA